MRLKSCSLAALLAFATASAAAAPAAAVVNGVPVDPASVPWFTTIGSGCGATLVAPDRLLTAAHCVGGAPAERLGAVVVGAQQRDVAHVAMHPRWRDRNGSNYLDDVAVLQLSAPVTGVPTVALGGVDAGEAQILGRGRAFAPGTGHSEAEMLDSTLRSAVLKTIGDAACARAFEGRRISTGERFDPRMRCAIDADGRAPLYSGCFGDSGGPLWTGTPQAPVQLGVVSWGGHRCGADHLPSVFADVGRYRGFITDPAPTWAPTHTGAVVLSGTPRAGRTLRCSTRRYVPEAGVKLSYSWTVASRSAVVRLGRSYRVAQADRGRRVTCHSDAVNDGGHVAVGSANVLIRRR